MRRLLFASLLLVMEPVLADGLGRLFTTPQQRAQLAAGVTDPATNSHSPGAAPELQGIIRRNDGSAVVWLNGRALKAGEMANGVSLVSTTRGSVILRRSDGTAFTVKPGQSLGSAGVREPSHSREDGAP